MRTLGEDEHLLAKKRCLRRRQPCQPLLDLGLLAFKAMRQHISLVEGTGSVALRSDSPRGVIHYVLVRLSYNIVLPLPSGPWVRPSGALSQART